MNDLLFHAHGLFHSGHMAKCVACGVLKEDAEVVNKRLEAADALADGAFYVNKEDGGISCHYCGGVGQDKESYQHHPDCPVAAYRRTEGGKG